MIDLQGAGRAARTFFAVGFSRGLLPPSMHRPAISSRLGAGGSFDISLAWTGRVSEDETVRGWVFYRVPDRVALAGVWTWPLPLSRHVLDEQRGLPISKSRFSARVVRERVRSGQVQAEHPTRVGTVAATGGVGSLCPCLGQAARPRRAVWRAVGVCHGADELWAVRTNRTRAVSSRTPIELEGKLAGGVP